MERPYIFCHMLTSLDGKIMGRYMDTEAGAAASAAFYDIAFGDHPHYHHQGWLSGRVSSDDNFTFYEKPALDAEDGDVPPGDFIAVPDAEMYYVSVDPSGCLAWKEATLRYQTTEAHIIEVLTERAASPYKAFLRRLGISYIIAGDAQLDAALALAKLKRLFGIETLMLGGGAVLNWSFIQAGLCDEVSVVVAAASDGATETPSLFAQRPGLSTDAPVTFFLQSAQVLPGDCLWLRYLVNEIVNNERTNEK